MPSRSSAGFSPNPTAIPALHGSGPAESSQIGLPLAVNWIPPQVLSRAAVDWGAVCGSSCSAGVDGGGGCFLVRGPAFFFEEDNVVDVAGVFFLDLLGLAGRAVVVVAAVVDGLSRLERRVAPDGCPLGLLGGMVEIWTGERTRGRKERERTTSDQFGADGTNRSHRLLLNSVKITARCQFPSTHGCS